MDGDRMPSYPTAMNDASKAVGGSDQRLVRPKDVPDIGGCPADCGHTDEEHIAFDVGVMDGRLEREDPSVDLGDDWLLRDAWEAGYSTGKLDRPNDKVQEISGGE